MERVIRMFVLIFMISLMVADVLSFILDGVRVHENEQSYRLKREQLFADELKMRMGHGIKLTPDEERVNKILMNEKQKEVNRSRQVNGPLYPPSVHFFKGKEMIDASAVFKIIKDLPKGAVLHLHDCSITDPWWLVNNVTYRDNCYMCVDNTSSVHFHFWKTQAPPNPGCEWKLVKDQRNAYKDKKAFNQMLYNNMSMVLDDPVKAYPTIDVVWKVFLQRFDQANGLINYLPVFKDYFYEALQEFHNDNVQYMELRGLLPEVYDLTGATLNKTEVLKIYNDQFEKFIKDNQPNFSGGKFIYSGLRFISESDVLAQVKESITFMQQFPDHFAGYDLVGQEDPGKPLIDYLDALLYPSQQNPPINLPYFFHAGETDWQGTVTDRNLMDALLLNTTRIGHGYALLKHPKALELVKSRKVAVEVNPISNQVLMLVDDLRNHPAAALIADDYPVVISADDPSVWGAVGLSYDFYMAFMGLAGENADLKVLKQLAMNSLMYSAMSDVERSKAMALWKKKWDVFISKTLSRYNHSKI